MTETRTTDFNGTGEMCMHGYTATGVCASSHDHSLLPFSHIKSALYYFSRQTTDTEFCHFHCEQASLFPSCEIRCYSGNAEQLLVKNQREVH